MCQAVLGLLLWLIISLKFAENPEIIGIVVGAVTQLATVGMMTSASFRCIGLLCLSEMLTKRGRAIFLLMVTAWVLQGPANNLNTNQVLVGKTLACVSDKMKNDTQALKVR